MVGSIREILKLTDTQSFLEAQEQYDKDLHGDEGIATLQALLDKNIMSTDVTDIQRHMCLVESYRARLVKYLAFAIAFKEHAKGTTFLMPKQAGKSDVDREAHRRHMSASPEALCKLLEGLIECIDSRCNMCKKVYGVEETGSNYGNRKVT